MLTFGDGAMTRVDIYSNDSAATCNLADRVTGFPEPQPKRLYNSTFYTASGP